MAQTINTNTIAINAQRNLQQSQSSLATSMQRLSSGVRVNSAKDDAAGLAIAERMQAQIRGLNAGVRNANDGISLAQTAEGALGKMGEMLQRMRELAVQARNSTNSTGDRANLQKEFGQLQDEVKRMVESSKFNNRSLFNSQDPEGTFEPSLVFQVGANAAASDRIEVTSINLNGTAQEGSVILAATNPNAADVLATSFKKTTDASQPGIAIGGWTALGTSNPGAEIDEAIEIIDLALAAINDQRATFGATQNRFEAAIANLQVAAENQSAARARIMDADFAAETANLSRVQILQQAGTAMLAQANAQPQAVLKLLGG